MRSETECWEGDDQLDAYIKIHGDPEGLNVYTHCGNCDCCNPWHLFTAPRPLGETQVFKPGDRVLVCGLLHKPHTGRVRCVGERDAPEFLGSQNFTLVDIDLPNGDTVAHQFFLDDDRLSLL